jgi:hypothetical protein
MKPELVNPPYLGWLHCYLLHCFEIPHPVAKNILAFCAILQWFKGLKGLLKNNGWKQKRKTAMDDGVRISISFRKMAREITITANYITGHLVIEFPNFLWGWLSASTSLFRFSWSNFLQLTHRTIEKAVFLDLIFAALEPNPERVDTILLTCIV